MKQTVFQCPNRSRFLAFILSVLLFTISSCQNADQQKQKELALKQRELDIREKELALKEKSQQAKSPSKVRTENLRTPAGKQKELRYLYYANGGLIGYFNDGTIAGCPRCDFCRSNILNMFNEQPIGTYTVNDDGSLLVNHTERRFPKPETENAGDNWPLIDYQWNEKVPQY